MSKQGFYLDNMFRTYPFVDPITGSIAAFPKSTIVDFNCYIYDEVGYVEGVNTVWLHSTERVSDTFIFKFASDATGLSGNYLTFAKSINDPEMSYSFSDSSGDYTSSSIPIEDSCPKKIIWEGYLVAGNLSELAGLMPNDGIAYSPSSEAKIEPSLIINIQNSNIRTINIANKVPTQATSPGECPDYPELDGIKVHKSCITGDVIFDHGYSCNVAVSTSTNEITFTTALAEAVKGQVCDDILFTTQGPDCADTLKSINGMGAKRLWIVGGKGISLSVNQTTFSIDLYATLSGLAVCANPEMYLSSAILD
jgi:hypothetical protein